MQHELSPLLLVPIGDAKNAKQSRHSNRFVALLLVSATAAAAAVMVLMNYSLRRGVNPIVSALSSLLGTGRTKGESCASPWWNACGDHLSCYDNGSRRYCVPMGQNYACCGWDGDEASGVDCLKGLYCDDRTKRQFGTVSTCHPNKREYGLETFAKKGSCNVNTGEGANILIEVTCHLTCSEHPTPYL